MPLDLNQPFDVYEILNDIQGNILRPHGRKCVSHTLLWFPSRYKRESRRFLSQLGEEVTSALKQYSQKQRYSESNGKESGGVFISLWLSIHAFNKLELRPVPEDEAFNAGMSERRSVLDDPDPEKWDDTLRDPDALLLIADDEWGIVEQERSRLIPRPYPEGFTLFEHRGEEKGKGKIREEPFGFRDGITNPEVVGHIPVDWSHDELRQPLFPLRHVLVEYPKAVGGTPGYGSYFVFRKLEQDTKHFHDLLMHLASKLDPPQLELAERAIVGRDKKGKVAAKKEVGKNFAWQDLEDYGGDYCPFQAHIRRANPRGESGERAEHERAHLIVRRGIPYKAANSESLPGTLFICCQSDIKNQFEYVQGQWLNAAWGGVAERHDPLAGQKPRVEQLWPEAPGQQQRVSFTFESCITLKGGEYFFAPPITFLKSLKDL